MIIPIIFLLIASYTDIKDRKIKNYTTYPMFLIGLYFADNFLISIGIGALLGIVILLLPGFSVGMGDVKLIIACGAWFNDLETAIYFMLIAISLVTLFNILGIIKKEGFKNLFKQLKAELFLAFLRIIPEEEVNKAPLAPFILVSFAGVMWLI